MEEITIVIYKSTSEKGFSYDIYKENLFDRIEYVDFEPEDGGQCTTTMKNAIEMACSQAKHLIEEEPCNHEEYENGCCIACGDIYEPLDFSGGSLGNDDR